MDRNCYRNGTAVFRVATAPGQRRGGYFVWALMLGAACFSILLFGCRQSEPPTLRIAINAWPGYELIYLAQEKGYFAEAGVKVRLVKFGSLSDARRAYETGKVDGLATTVVEVLVARDEADRDLRIVRVIDFSNGADVIVAKADTRSLLDLRGKRIGVEVASLGIYILARALELEGMSLADVTPVSKDQRTMREALLAGDLEAVVTYPPTSVDLMRDADFRVVFSTLKLPGEVVDVMAMDGDMLRQHPGQVNSFLRALDRAHAYLKSQPEDACRIMAEREGISPRDFQTLLRESITLVKASEQAPYFGENGTLARVVERIAQCLRQVELLSVRPEVTDCLAAHE